MKHLFLFLVMLPVVGYAVDVPIVVPDGDPLQALLMLFASWKTAGPLAIGSMIIVVAVQAMKKMLPEFKYKRIAVTALGIVYGVLLAVSNGMGVVEASIAALFVSGGAVAIYEALKVPLKKMGIV